jgi:hypothetical protein
VPVDSTSEVQLSDHKKTELQAFLVFEALIESTFRNKFPMMILVESKFAS